MPENIDVVLGCSFGDEGKGKVVYDLLLNNNYDLCIRFNGSGNAGHTIYKNGQKLILHQLPVGVLISKVYNLISSDCLIDIPRLKSEINDLKLQGIDITGRLFISKACHIITPECIEYDKQNNLIGTTGSGIGPTFSQKMLRIGQRVEQFSQEITSLGIQIVDMRKFWFSDFVQNNIKNMNNFNDINDGIEDGEDDGIVVGITVDDIDVGVVVGYFDGTEDGIIV